MLVNLLKGCGVVVLVAGLSACANPDDTELTHEQECARMNSKIVQSPYSPTGQGNFLAQYRENKNADEDRAWARKMHCLD